MQAKRVLVLFGGCSPEYSVSLQSAYSVLSVLDRRKIEPIAIGITRSGKWFRYFGDLSGILSDTWHLRKSECTPALISPDRDRHVVIELHKNQIIQTEFDIAFPVLHGKNGEDGTLQGLFEAAGIPFVGCGMLCSALCIDKYKAHEAVARIGIKVPACFIASGKVSMEEIQNMAENLTFPLFVKPVKAGSSFGISQIERAEELPGAVDTALLYDDQVILEERITGSEVGCAILGNDELVLGTPDEIELNGGFFDYTEKYTLKTSKIHVPARIDKHTAAQISQTAVSIYKVLGCRGFARVDLFLTPENDIVFNEVNTIPGLTAHSRYPNMMKGAGYQLSDIVNKLISLGLADENHSS
ncbi:MAG: D-alanine--D-serine ligase VanG [Clostridiales bacterium]|jgi:D-alanine---D-serine ligase|nr:D-alanine--D-serine ligase VanG [Clostridiales bacterium]